jgi:uncharacterized protein YaiI (UPF0178 family)
MSLVTGCKPVDAVIAADIPLPNTLLTTGSNVPHTFFRFQRVSNKQPSNSNASRLQKFSSRQQATANTL